MSKFSYYYVVQYGPKWIRGIVRANSISEATTILNSFHGFYDGGAESIKLILINDDANVIELDHGYLDPEMNFSNL